ncbi:GNAT family N-acetyltransferase [Brevibacterium sp. CCUG 69071]|nr:GNAT family N-acetyltransferase [Brevibacterium sp. CCUG 69071]
MARVHVDSWEETYRGLMPDDLLDDPDALDQRRQMWTRALDEDHQRTHTCAVADQDGRIVGVAMSGPSRDDDRPDERELFILYTYRAVQGSGAGQGLLDLVVEPGTACHLWVADPNPRAQAFYSKNGFVPDGSVKTDDYDGVREIRMVRAAES